MEENRSYNLYTTEDFVNDEYFQDWVFNPEKISEEFWKRFIKENPEKIQSVESAQQILRTIPFNELAGGEEPTDEHVRASFLKVSKLLNLKAKKGTLVSLSTWWVAAASVVLVLTFAYLLIERTNKKPLIAVSVVEEPVNDVAPGGNKAFLTLGNGQTVLLDSASTGTVLTQGGSVVKKVTEGELMYEKSGEPSEQKNIFNTITIPRGGQYNLTLSDGTRVWLNAQSSLKFPVAFTGKERRVELSGEGYFEVSKDAGKPFIVDIGQAAVRVLGTHFNVKAYSDEQTATTTLVEGLVEVENNESRVLIKPAQQAVINRTNESINVTKASVQAAIAWKNGLFQFENTDLKTIMKQIGRWYDVDVNFEEGVPEKRFTGKIYRNVNASEVFQILEVLDVHFKIVGKKVIVTK